MTGLQKQIGQYGSRVIALLLCFYLSGAVAVANCLATSCHALVTEQAVKVADEETPPCHRQQQPNEQPTNKDNSSRQTVIDDQQTPSAACCSFKHLPSDGVRRSSSSDEQPPIAAAPLVQSPLPKVEHQRIAFRVNYRSIPLNRGSTYLRCCVFLI